MSELIYSKKFYEISSRSQSYENIFELFIH
jgi:hypothetical protein